MAEFWDRPLCRAVALGAIGPKEADVLVFSLVTRRAVEQRLLALQSRIQWQRVVPFEPGNNLIASLVMHGRRILHLPQRYAGETDVVHFRRSLDSALMFEMTGGTLGYVGMKGAWLPLEDCFVVGVANDAVLCLHSFEQRVTCGAIVFEKSMR